jgi:hypothetical protein
MVAMPVQDGTIPKPWQPKRAHSLHSSEHDVQCAQSVEMKGSKKYRRVVRLTTGVQRPYLIRFVTATQKYNLT